MKKRLALILVILITSLAITADDPIAEAEKKLETVTGNEKNKVLILLAHEYLNIAPAKSVEYGSQALELSKQLKNQEGIALAYEKISIGYALLGELEKAIEATQNAAKAFEKNKDKIGVANSYNTLGNVYNNLSDYNKALEYHNRALEIRKSIGHKIGIGDSLNNIGLVYNNMGNYDQALESYLDSLKIREEIGDKRTISQGLNNVGLVYDNLGNYENALKYYSQSLKLDEELGDKRSIANVLNNMGNVYDSLKKSELALEYQLKAKNLREEIGDKRGIAASLDNLGVTYGNLGKYREALDYHLKALELREKIGEKSGVGTTLLNIGEIYLNLKNFDEALKYLNRSIKIAREIEARHLLQYGYQFISALYTDKEDYKNALEYYKRYTEVKDSIMNKQANDKMAELQAKYQSEKKEKEIALLEKNNRIQVITRNAFIVGFILVFIIALLLFNKYIYLIAFWKKKNYIGHYRINDQIGSGGMGIVYKASHVRESSKSVAIKVIREEYSQDPVQRKRFLNEAILVDQMNHPNIVKVYERGEYNQQLFIAMELLEGQSLAGLIQKGVPIPVENGLKIMRQLADALAKVHSKGVIHRDIKPENIILIEKEEDKHFVKLLDFGLAKSQSLTQLTQSGEILGTVSYLPPERITQQKFSTASDIYSLGVVCYEMFTLEKPFMGEVPIDIIKQILEKEPIPPGQLRPDISGDLSDLILKMMSKIPDERPTEDILIQSIEAFAARG